MYGKQTELESNRRDRNRDERFGRAETPSRNRRWGRAVPLHRALLKPRGQQQAGSKKYQAGGQ
jgi:hypothetical protein